jgi:hypothetical protein
LYSFPLGEGIKNFTHLRTLFDLKERFLSRLVVATPCMCGFAPRRGATS